MTSPIPPDDIIFYPSSSNGQCPLTVITFGGLSNPRSACFHLDTSHGSYIVFQFPSLFLVLVGLWSTDFYLSPLQFPVYRQFLPIHHWFCCFPFLVATIGWRLAGIQRPQNHISMWKLMVLSHNDNPFLFFL